MMKISDIKYMAKNKLEDSEVLYRARRYDGSYYLCGYATELGLKYKICVSLNWDSYFDNFNSFKIHNLDDLLRLSGIEKYIRSNFVTEWSFIRLWNPEKRYQPVGIVKAIDVKNILRSSKIILGELL
jgi:hypothetical protein